MVDVGLVRPCAPESALLYLWTEYAKVNCSEAAKESTVYALQLAHQTDEDYAEWHVRQRQRTLQDAGVTFSTDFAAVHRPRSNIHIKSELFVKGIASELVDEALQEYDEVAACR